MDWYWLFTAATVAGFAAGLFIIAGGVKPERRVDFGRSEEARRWGLLTAVAVAQAAGVTVGLWSAWDRDDFQDLAGSFFWTWGAVLVGVGGLVAFAAYTMRSHRNEHFSFPDKDDYPIRGFRVRQGVVIVLFVIAFVMALSGSAATATVAQGIAKSDQKGVADVQDLIGLRADFAVFMTAAALEVVAVVILVTVAQTALKRGLPQRSQAHLRPGDPLALGIVLSLAMASVILPSYLLLQGAGRTMTESIMGDKSLNSDWFTLHDQVQSALAPTPFGSAALISAILAVLSPVLTAAVADAVGKGKAPTARSRGGLPRRIARMRNDRP